MLSSWSWGAHSVLSYESRQQCSAYWKTNPKSPSCRQCSSPGAHPHPTGAVGLCQLVLLGQVSLSHVQALLGMRWAVFAAWAPLASSLGMGMISAGSWKVGSDGGPGAWHWHTLLITHTVHLCWWHTHAFYWTSHLPANKAHFLRENLSAFHEVMCINQLHAIYLAP